MLMNIFLYVPSILIDNRYEGTVLAIPIGILIGTTFLYLFTISLNKFPAKGVPEVLEYLPNWFRIGFLVYFSIMWFLAGCVALMAFNNITIRMVNPDIPGTYMIGIFAIGILLILARLKTKNILYLIEIILVINLPLIFIILSQSFFSEYFTWPSIIEVAGHFKAIPSFEVIAACSFVFSGYTNMVVFNKVFKEKINVKRLWFIPILGLFNLLTTVFIPIGYWGADGVGELTYPWIATADTLFIEFGPIERLITPFILLYVSISIISVVVHWHVALEVIKTLFKWDKLEGLKRPILLYSILATFGIFVLLMELNFNEKDILLFGSTWLQVRLPSELILVLLMLFLARRRNKYE
jgi:hypothetical protein